MMPIRTSTRIESRDPRIAVANRGRTPSSSRKGVDRGHRKRVDRNAQVGHAVVVRRRHLPGPHVDLDRRQDQCPHLERNVIDRRLVIGSVLFGIGWGVAGFCPGPALVALGLGEAKALVFVIAMLIGMGIFELLERRRQATPLLAT